MLKSLFQYIIATFILLFVIWFAATQPVWQSKKDKQLPEVSDAALYSYVKTLSKELPPREASEKQLEPTIQWIEKQLSPYGKPYRQSYQIHNENYHNVILEFGPQNGDILVIGAHYDTANGLPGADDNASGVAGLLELARLISENNLENKLTTGIQLVAFTLEEPIFYGTDLMGSYIHAQSLKQDNRSVKLMISLEMIGYFSDEPRSQKFPIPFLEYIYPNKGNFIGIIGNLSNMSAVRSVKKSFKKAIDLDTYSFNAPALVPGIDYSDHRNYWAMGYPAVMITDTSFNRNTAYHTPFDIAERLNYKKMAQVIQGVYQVILDYQITPTP